MARKETNGVDGYPIGGPQDEKSVTNSGQPKDLTRVGNVSGATPQLNSRNQWVVPVSAKIKLATKSYREEDARKNPVSNLGEQIDRLVEFKIDQSLNPILKPLDPRIERNFRDLLLAVSKSQEMSVLMYQRLIRIMFLWEEDLKENTEAWARATEAADVAARGLRSDAEIMARSPSARSVAQNFGRDQ